MAASSSAPVPSQPDSLRDYHATISHEGTEKEPSTLKVVHFKHEKEKDRLGTAQSPTDRITSSLMRQLSASVGRDHVGGYNTTQARKQKHATVDETATSGTVPFYSVSVNNGHSTFAEGVELDGPVGGFSSVAAETIVVVEEHEGTRIKTIVKLEGPGGGVTYAEQKREPTNSSTGSRRQLEAKRYLQATFAAHFVWVGLILAYEAMFLLLCCRVTTVAPYVEVKLAFDNLETAHNLLGECNAGLRNDTSCTSAVGDVTALTTQFDVVAIKAVAESDQIFVYEVIYTILTLLWVGVIAAIVYRNRQHPAVKSRGTLYLYMMFLTGAFYNLAMLYITAIYLFQITPLVPAALFDELKRSLFVQSTLLFTGFASGILGACLFWSSMVMRQRMIALIYNQKLSASAHRGWYLIAWACGLTFFVFIISMSTYIAWYVHSYHHPRDTAWGISGLFCVAFFSWAILYYLSNTQRASIQFNDVFSNIRLLVVINASFFVLMLYNFVHPHHIISHCVGWSSIGRYQVVLQTMDQFSTQLIQALWYGGETGSSNRGASILIGTQRYGLLNWARVQTPAKWVPTHLHIRTCPVIPAYTSKPHQFLLTPYSCHTETNPAGCTCPTSQSAVSAQQATTDPRNFQPIIIGGN